jgi:hypothetical protein
MKSLSIGFLVVVAMAAAGCSGSEGRDDEAEAVGSTSAALSTPQNDIFTVWKSSAKAWNVKYIGSAGPACVDGGAGPGCTVDVLNLGGAGVSAASQALLMSKIALNDPNESATAVLLRGTMTRVRDHRTTPASSYSEFRAVAVYTAPSVRTHVTNFAYLEPLPGSPSQQAATAVNPQQLAVVVPVHVNWALPPGNTHPNGVIDDAIATGTANGGSAGPITTTPVPPGPPLEVRVDQLFLRLR